MWCWNLNLVWSSIYVQRVTDVKWLTTNVIQIEYELETKVPLSYCYKSHKAVKLLMDPHGNLEASFEFYVCQPTGLNYYHIPWENAPWPLLQHTVDPTAMSVLRDMFKRTPVSWSNDRNSHAREVLDADLELLYKRRSFMLVPKTERELANPAWHLLNPWIYPIKSKVLRFHFY